MDLAVVVAEVGILELLGELADWLAKVGLWVLGADHETNLSSWVGGDGGESVLDDWEDLLAVLLDLLDEWKVKELVLALGGDDTALLESSEEKGEVWLLEESLGWSVWVGGVGDNNVKLVLVVIKELETISDVDLDLWVLVGDSHSWKVLLGKTDNGLEGLLAMRFVWV